MRTLLLDDSYLPIKIISWQRAMILMLTDRAEMVMEYEDKVIRSVSVTYQLPKILKLYSRHKGNKTIKFNRFNVFIRDNFTCQYCSNQFPVNKLTLDHVHPISRGGATNWVNIVTACAKCNIKKGDKTPSEARMYLPRKPFEPKWNPRIYLRLKQDDPIEWHQWMGNKKPA